MLVELLNLGDAGTTHVSNPPKYQLFLVSGVWMEYQERSRNTGARGEGRICEPSDYPTLN